MSHSSFAIASWVYELIIYRFDGRTIRVDKASDNGPRGGGGFGRGGGGYGRGGFGGPAPYGMGHPGPGYQMPAPNMYAPMPYGRGYPPQQGYGGPPQGMMRIEFGRCFTPWLTLT